MGLDIYLVGEGYDDDEFTQEYVKEINEFLDSAGYEKYNNNPRDIEPRPNRGHRDRFGYSRIHFLRVAMALNIEGLPQVRAGQSFRDFESVVDRLCARGENHTIYHSDCDGYYAPVIMGKTTFDVGSCFSVIDELKEVAPAIGVTVTDGRLDDEEAARLKAHDSTELQVWFSLWEIMKQAIHCNLCVKFS